MRDLWTHLKTLAAIGALVLCAVHARASPKTLGPPVAKSAKEVPSPPPAKKALVPIPELELTPVDLNTATTAELETLPGVGPAKAKRIVEYRARRGPFRRIRDLRRVKGFGRKTLQKLRPYLMLTVASDG